jgi:hypothetical protein
MTVAELIAKLQTYDGNKEVQVWHDLERRFTTEVIVEPHSKRPQVVWVLARHWHSPWGGVR